MDVTVRQLIECDCCCDTDIIVMMMWCLVLTIFQHCMTCIKKRIISSTHDTYNRRMLLQVGDVDRTLDLSSNDFCGVMVQYPDTKGEFYAI